jgi:hypothetical protein
VTKLTLTANGALTLSAQLLQHLGVRPGSLLDVTLLPDGRIELEATRARGHISDVFGMLKRPDGPVYSIEEINDIAARGWAGEFGNDCD